MVGIDEWLREAFSGPGRVRFVLQPAVAILLGLRDGRLDASTGRAPYLWALVFHAGRRGHLWSAFRAAAVPLGVAVGLDSVLQLYTSDTIHLGWALAVGGLLVALPYMAARGIGNRIASAGRRRRSA